VCVHVKMQLNCLIQLLKIFEYFFLHVHQHKIFHCNEHELKKYFCWSSIERETLSFNPFFFFPFFIGDGQIASNMAVCHSTMFSY